MAESTQVLLLRLLSMVEAQGKEIQALRQEVRALKGSDPTPRRAHIEPVTGYEYMGLCLDLDADTWLAIKHGARVTPKGQGYVGYEQSPDPDDPDFVWDYWEFSGGIGHRLRVTLASPRQTTSNAGPNWLLVSPGKKTHSVEWLNLKRRPFVPKGQRQGELCTGSNSDWASKQILF